jgi:thiol-disulfide isomerase/thioredoxin
MRRLLIGTWVLTLAVVALRAEEEKSVVEIQKALFQELLKKYPAAGTAKEKQEVLTDYSQKFVDLAKSAFDLSKNRRGGASVDILALVVGFPLPFTKDGPQSKAAALLKNIINKSDDKEVRVKALNAYMGAQEKVLMNSKNAKAIAAAKKEIERYRKVIKSDFKDEIKDLFIGSTMPELKSKNLDDKDVKLSDLKGKVVVLDIWATWCPPCRAMIPHSRELVKKLKDKPFVLVSISADAKKETLTNFMEKNEMPWTHWWNGTKGGILSDLDVVFFPTIYVLDGKGVIRYKNVRDKAMDKAVKTLLKEMSDTRKGDK